MASLAEIQRFLKQRRAIGKTVSGEEARRLFEGFFDAQAGKNIERGRLALERRRVDLSEESVAAQREQSDRSFALQERQREDAQDAAKIAGITEIGKLGLTFAGTDIGSKTFEKIGDVGGKAISGVKDFLTPDVVDSVPTGAITTGAQGIATKALTSLGGGGTVTGGVTGASIPAADATSLGIGVPTGSSIAPTAATSLTSALTTAGTSLVAGIAADKLIGDKVKEAGGIASGAVAGFAAGGPLGAVIGGVIGGFGGKVATEAADFGKSAFKKVTRVFGTWLCTETKERVGFTDEEWEGIFKFRSYAEEHHPDWLRWYVSIGPELIFSMNEDDAFYKNLKETFLLPMIHLGEGGFYEAVCRSYISVVKQLVMKYNKDLIVNAPEV